MGKDKVFAYNFERADHSRVNLAFKRWQTRVFAAYNGLPIKRVLQHGEIAPKLEGVNYTWPELFEHKNYKKLIGRVRQLGKAYLKRSGFDPQVLKRENPNSKMLIFPWVEVFNFGEALRPMSRSDGA